MKLICGFLLAVCLSAQILVPIVGNVKHTGGGSVTFDVIGINTTIFSGTAISGSHTVTNALVNSAVVAILSWEVDYATVSSCTYNGSSMTQMWNFRETGANISGSAGFIIPTGTGDGTAHTLSCTTGAAATNGTTLLSLSFGGVNQATPFRTASTANIDTTSGSASLVVSNAASGDMVVDGFTNWSDALAAVSTQTIRLSHNSGNGYSGYTSTAAATGSTTMGYNSFTTTEHFSAFGAAAVRP